MADMRYANGDENFFWTVRGGLIAPEGYGASDQWIDDGGIPLFDTNAAIHLYQDGTTGNFNTMATPLGAMNVPQMGVELGLNWVGKYLTLGVYNGFDATGGINSTNTPPQPAQMNAQGKGSKDFKIQYDQMFEAPFALTAIYYNGRTASADPGSADTPQSIAPSVAWQNEYQLGRLYGTWFAIPNKVDVFAGAAYGSYEFDNISSSTIAGHFYNYGAFVGGSYYVQRHLTLAGRLDYLEYDSTVSPKPKSQAASIYASLPFENNMWVFHLTRTEDYINGLTNDFRAEWRFLF